MTPDGRLWIPESEELEKDNQPHLVQGINDTVWEFKEIANDCNWEGYQAVIAYEGALYEIHIQTKSHFELAQQDHQEYKMRQLEGLSPEQNLLREQYKNALQDLFLFVALSRNVSRDLLNAHPLLAAKYEYVKAIYS